MDMEVVVTTTCYFDTTLNTTMCANLLVLHTTAKPEHQAPFSLWMTILFGVAICVIGLISAFGNGVMILAFVIERKIRQPENYFLVSLAVTDLIAGTFSMPLYSLYTLGGKWVLGQSLCEVWMSVDWSSFLTARYTILLMTLNRFVENKYPLEYQCWHSRIKILIAIASLQLIPIVIFFTLFMKTYHKTDISTYDQCEVPFVIDTLFTCLFLFSYYWFPMVASGILHFINYNIIVHRQEMSEENYRRDFESHTESSSQHINDTMLNNKRHRHHKNNNSISDCRVTEIKTESTSKSKKDVKPGKNMQPYPHGLAYLEISALIDWRGRHDDYVCSRDTNVDSKEEDMRFIKVDQPPGLVTEFRANMCEPTYPDWTDAGVLISHFKTGDQKMSKGTSRTHSQRLTSPSQLPQNSPGSIFQGSPQKALVSVYSSASSDRPDKQARPLLTRQIRRRSQIIAEESPPMTRSSKTDVLIPAAGESEREDMDRTHLHTSSIFKRRSSLLPLASGVFDLDDVNHRLWTTEQTTSTDLPTAFTAHSSTACSYLLDEQHPVLDNRNPEIFIRVSDGGTQPHNEPLGDVGARGNSPGNSNNNEDSDSDEDTIDPTIVAQHSHQPGTRGKTTNSRKDVTADEGLSSSETHYPLNIQPTSRKQTSDHVTTKSHTGRREKRGRKSLRTISFVIVSHIMCWTPYHVLVIMLTICANCVNHRLYSFTYWLCYISSCINPFCYAYADAHIKRAFIRVLKLDWKNRETVV